MQALRFMSKSRKSWINSELVNDIEQDVYFRGSQRREFDDLLTDYLKSQDFPVEIADG